MLRYGWVLYFYSSTSSARCTGSFGRRSWSQTSGISCWTEPSQPGAPDQRFDGLFPGEDWPDDAPELAWEWPLTACAGAGCAEKLPGRLAVSARAEAPSTPTALALFAWINYGRPLGAELYGPLTLTSERLEQGAWTATVRAALEAREEIEIEEIEIESDMDGMEWTQRRIVYDATWWIGADPREFGVREPALVRIERQRCQAGLARWSPPRWDDNGFGTECVDF